MNARTTRAFTIIELLVVVSIIALLVGILLPAITEARDQAKLNISQSNLRNLAAAHGAYAAEWNDRQFTLVDDNAAAYGDFGDWFSNYADAHGSDGSWDHPGNHPAADLGWGHTRSGEWRHFYYSATQRANASLCLPIVIGWGGTTTEYFGAFRLPNAAQFNQYVSGRFYDKVFYAPKDVAPWRSAEPCFESPDTYCTRAEVNSEVGDIPAWSSYCLSPAAMFNPEVFAPDDPTDGRANGYRDAFERDGGGPELPAAFRSPSHSQALYPGLKTHMLEHNWLQNSFHDCNPDFVPGTYYGGCEPYYFNHGWESNPLALFYDGHIEVVGVKRATRADERVRVQSGDVHGLWSRDTPWGCDGYLSAYAYDLAETSFHILTTRGIRGRDFSTE